MSLQKVSKKNLKKYQDSFVRGPDLDQNITDPQHWFRIGSLLARSGPVFVFTDLLWKWVSCIGPKIYRYVDVSRNLVLLFLKSE
jgi:hypothetical protein